MSRKSTTKTAPQATETKTTEVTFSAKDLATELGTDPKSFRRWLRAHTEDRANKGGRWVFTADAKDQLIAAYKAPTEEPSTED